MQESKTAKDLRLIAACPGPIGENQGPEGIATRAAHAGHKGLVRRIADALKTRVGKNGHGRGGEVTPAGAATHLASGAHLIVGQETPALQTMEDICQLEAVNLLVHGAVPMALQRRRSSPRTSARTVP